MITEAKVELLEMPEMTPGCRNSLNKVAQLINFLYICEMRREILTYGTYYDEFMQTLSIQERKKIHYILDLLITEDKVSTKFVKYIREGIYELRAMYNSKIYRLFFLFDEGSIVILLNGFQKKTQQTPEKEIQKAIKIKNAYYESKE